MILVATTSVSTNIRNLSVKVIRRIRSKMIKPRIMVSAQTLSDEKFLAQFNLRKVSTLLKQGDMPAAKAALIAHYDDRVTSAWPAHPDVVPDLCADTTQLSQDKLIAMADAFLEHRFVLAAEENAFALSSKHAPRETPQGKIDWGFNPTPDSEWHRALHRHQWWVILGLAYTQTMDERYATEFVSQMLDWIKNNPPPAQKNEKSPSWRLMEVAMRTYISWVPAFALFCRSSAFTVEAKLTMLRSIYDHAQFLFLFKSRHNHLLRESNGLAYIGIHLPEFKEAKRWQQVALTRLDRELINQVNQDGSHVEVSTGYQWLVVDEYQSTCDLLWANNLSLPNENLASWLEKMYQVLAYLIRPDGTFPQINDGLLGDKDTLLTKLSQAGETFGRDDFIYIGTSGERGTCPRDASVGFNDAGLYSMRSDWSSESRYLLFDAGPYGGHHGHEDKLSIELYAFDQSFIVDSGSYTYDKKEPFRTYFVGSQGHNTILVDGKSQVRRWRRVSPKPVSGNYATWVSQPDFDYVAATYSDGYSTFSLQKPKEPAIIKDVTHTRHILFVKPDYWVMIDELQASTPHDYQLLFHTHPEIEVRDGPESRAILSTASRAATLCLIPANPQNIKLSWLAGQENPIQGWYSAGYNQKTPSNVVIYERKNSSSTAIATLLYPCPAGQIDNQVNIEPLTVSGGQGLAFVVTTSNGSDYLLFAQDENLKQFGPYQSRGIVAGIRTDTQGNILSRFKWVKSPG